MFDKEEIAAVLDNAHDELLIRGWIKGKFEDAEGHVCAVGAIDRVLGRNCLSRTFPLHLLAQRALAEQVWGFKGYLLGVPEWNDCVTTTEDDVFDAFRQAAKKVRDGEIDPFRSALP